MIKRRDFIKTSVAASALASVGQASLQAAPAPGAGNRDYYELRAYRLKAGASHELLDNYLEKAAIPALNRIGVKNVGVFTEMEPKDGTAIWMLIPYPSLDMFSTAAARVHADPEYQKAGEKYLASPKTEPAFERIDSWLHLAFAGMPRLEVPELTKEKKSRIFEMRTYESHSEVKALKKVEMFNSGEIDVMHEVKLSPVFYGQALIGRDLPHLTYMLCGENRDAHKKHFSDFGKHPTWDKLKNDPQYADTVSKIISRFLEPTPYSQI
ncbi:MAG TPA: NIPSNAP family protein [Candidatus Dormibacteraeota bacterium]|nr:NIPSNAP family protein [Candidatus Dormibacteraeota bacterium]